MNRTTKAGKKTAMVKVDAKTQKKLAKSGAALSELTGAFIIVTQDGQRRR